ncbi:hypothetical protein FACS189437_05900 [Bacteroidia bacterium]|nr:hypothetical protein FACS189437_05900 [Bacteroidia bacterium]
MNMPIPNLKINSNSNNQNKKILIIAAVIICILGSYGYSKYKKSADAKKAKAAAAEKEAQKKARAAAAAEEAARKAAEPPPPSIQPGEQEKLELIGLALEDNSTGIKKIMDAGNLDPNFSFNMADAPNFPLLKSKAKALPEKYLRPDSENWNLLFIASASKNKRLAEYLLTRTAQVNVPSPLGSSPLGAAIENNDTDMVKLFISKGAEINPNADYMAEALKGKNINLAAALVKAAREQNVDITPVLPDISELIKFGSQPVIKILLDEKMIALNEPLKNKILPILYAAAQNQTAILKDFVLAGVPVNSADESGRTALFYAAGETDSLNMSKFLVDSGANVNMESTKKVTALMMAASKQDNALATFLIDSGADVNAAADDGIRPLYLAAKTGNNSLLEALLNKDADANFQAVDGYTPLMLAANRGNYAAVNMLLKAGASNKYKNKQGYKASDIAAQKAFVNISDAITIRAK